VNRRWLVATALGLAATLLLYLLLGTPDATVEPAPAADVPASHPEPSSEASWRSLLPTRHPERPRFEDVAPAPPAEEEPTQVACPVRMDGPVPDRHAGLEHYFGPRPENAVVAVWQRNPDSDDPNAKLWASGSGLFHGDLLEFTPPPGFEGGRVHVDGYQPVEFSWDAAGCPTIELERAALVTGAVSPSWGDPLVMGCGNDAVVVDDGTYRLDAEPGSCEVRAIRWDGPVQVESEPVRIEPRLGAPTLVDLELPDALQGFLGIWVEPFEGGFVITRVIEGYAAHEADLREGDVVTTVDQVPTEEMAFSDWYEVLMGPTGEYVELQVSTDAGPRTVELERRFVDKPQ
jgi:hypothetical protein